MKANPPNCRDFLCSTGFVGVGLATGGSIIFAPDYAWALSTTAIDAHAAQTLLVMARQLFPHDRLGDQYYARRGRRRRQAGSERRGVAQASGRRCRAARWCARHSVGPA
jgi:hypothetical protein